MTDQENRSILAKGWMAKADDAFHAVKRMMNYSKTGKQAIILQKRFLLLTMSRACQ
jgi:hypothetical protein